jgi:hypothetical protein
MYRIVFLFLLSLSTFLVVGQDIPTSREIWDFEVGDKYGYYINYDNQMGCNLLKEVISKTLNGNDIAYVFKETKICNDASGTTFLPVDTSYLTIDVTTQINPLAQYDSVSYYPEIWTDTLGQTIPDSCMVDYVLYWWNSNCSNAIQFAIENNNISGSWQHYQRNDTLLTTSINGCEGYSWVYNTKYNYGSIPQFEGGGSYNESRYMIGLGRTYNKYEAGSPDFNDYVAESLVWFEKVNSFPCNVGLSDFNFKTPITIYPNPNNGSFAIKGLEANATYELSVINVQGKTVHNCSYSTYQTLEINHLKSGIYFLQLFNNEELTTFKFVKE